MGVRETVSRGAKYLWEIPIFDAAVAESIIDAAKQFNRTNCSQISAINPQSRPKVCVVMEGFTREWSQWDQTVDMGRVTHTPFGSSSYI